MVQLVDGDIRTREVLGWRGLHVFHFEGSSCSQKLRIFLNLKKIPWQSHPIDLPSNENMQPWFLGINPRGWCRCWFMRALCTSRAMTSSSISKNDFRPRGLFRPAMRKGRGAAQARRRSASRSAHAELSFRVCAARTAEAGGRARSYIVNGSGTVQGAKDHEKQVQIDFGSARPREGFTDAQARASALKFRAEFDALDQTLAKRPYLMGDHLSVLDIAWLIYEHRLSLAGYPFERRHPHVHAWAEKLRAMPEFAKEVSQLRHSRKSSTLSGARKLARR